MSAPRLRALASNQQTWVLNHLTAMSSQENVLISSSVSVLICKMEGAEENNTPFLGVLRKLNEKVPQSYKYLAYHNIRIRTPFMLLLFSILASDG